MGDETQSVVSLLLKDLREIKDEGVTEDSIRDVAAIAYAGKTFILFSYLPVTPTVNHHTSPGGTDTVSTIFHLKLISPTLTK